MAREPHFVVKYSSYLGTATKLVLYILKQLFASVSVNSGGYLPRRSGSVNIHRYSPPLRRIIVKYIEYPQKRLKVSKAVFTFGARALVPGHRHKMVLCSDTGTQDINTHFSTQVLDLVLGHGYRARIPCTSIASYYSSLCYKNK